MSAHHADQRVWHWADRPACTVLERELVVGTSAGLERVHAVWAQVHPGAYEGKSRERKKMSYWLLENVNQLMSIADLGHSPSYAPG